MAAEDKVIYEKFIIESTDGKKTVDIRQGVTFFSYFEDIFSPYISAKVAISNTGSTVKGEDGVMQSLLNGLPLRGGERVIIKIAGNSKINKGLDFSDDPDKYFYVASIKNILIDAERESFVLNLVSREALSNETAKVGRKFTSSQKISDSVQDILKDYLKTKKIEKIDETKNPYGFIGNLKKPFNIIRWLASKSVPKDGKKSSTAGFLFYQTINGFNFRSIDNLITQEPHEQEYTYRPGVVNDKDPNKDFTIKKFNFGNEDILGKLERGAYASQRFYLNPVDFTINKDTLFQGSDYVNSTPNLGEKIVNFFSFENGKNISQMPSRIFTAVLDVGTLEKNAKLTGWNDPSTRNADPAKIHSQSMVRYQQLKTQVVQIQIPCNMNLTAGTIIRCNFPRIDREIRKVPDQNQSGLYMISAIDHHFDSDGSVSQIELVRDTIGRK